MHMRDSVIVIFCIFFRLFVLKRGTYYTNMPCIYSSVINKSVSVVVIRVLDESPVGNIPLLN